MSLCGAVCKKCLHWIHIGGRVTVLAIIGHLESSRRPRNGFVSNDLPAEGQQDWFSVAEHGFSPFFWCTSVAGKLF